MANVIFKKGTAAQFSALAVKDANTLYWLTDTQELYKGDILYGKGAAATNLASGLMSAEDKAKLDAMSAGGTGSLAAVDTSVVIADGKIGVNLSAETGNALSLKSDGLFVATVSSAQYVMEKQETAEAGYTATYKLKKTENGESAYVGDAVNIPNAAVLTGGELKIVETANVPYEGAEVGDPYADLIVADTEQSHIYLPLKGLISTVAAGSGITVENNTVALKLDTVNANGLTVGANGLSLAAATASAAGAMSAADKAALDTVVACVTWGDMGDDAA